jgi:hypothetical protein
LVAVGCGLGVFVAVGCGVAVGVSVGDGDGVDVGVGDGRLVPVAVASAVRVVAVGASASVPAGALHPPSTKQRKSSSITNGVLGRFRGKVFVTNFISSPSLQPQK